MAAGGIVPVTVIERVSGPNLLVRFVWWLFIGWWASGLVGIPLGIWLINHLPSVLTLRPRTRTWALGQDAGAGR
jgi:hypothetical protein